MKKLNKTILLALIVGIIGTTGISEAMAQAPSKAAWFQQTAWGYDSTSKDWSISIKWVDGLVNENFPQAERYELYRAVIGHETPEDEFELITTIYEEEKDDGWYHYTDEMKIAAGYYYYLIAYNGDAKSEISQIIQAVTPGAYCVNLNAEIIDFISFPATMSAPGELYTYYAYAKHRSFRVQGFVRYHLIEGPEGATIDTKTGELKWEIPADADGSYYFEIKATSVEAADAESIQHWSVRIASDEDMLVNPTSVSNIEIINNTDLYPNPALNEIKVNYVGDKNNINISVFDISGNMFINQNRTIPSGENVLSIPVNGLYPGLYVLKIKDGNKITKGTFIISK